MRCRSRRSAGRSRRSGLHYLLIHYDVPLVDPAGCRARGRRRGASAHSRSTLDDLVASCRRARGDDGVRRQRSRAARAAARQPAVAHRGRRDGTLARRPARGVARGGGADGPSAVDVVFAGLDRGVEGDVEQRYERSLPLAEALEAGAVLAYEMNGGPIPPQHGFPLRLVVPGWYGMTNVKWLTEIAVVEEPYAGVPGRHRLPVPTGRGRGGAAGDADAAALPDGPARDTGLLLARSRIVDAGASGSKGVRGRGGRRSRGSR